MQPITIVPTYISSLDNQIAVVSEAVAQELPALQDKSQPALTEKDAKETAETVKDMWVENAEQFKLNAPFFRQIRFRELEQHIHKNQAAWSEQVKKQGRDILIKASPRCPRSLIYTTDNKIYVLFNKAKKRDRVIYERKEVGKIIKTAWQWGTTNWFANSSVKRKDGKDYISYAKRVLDLGKGIKGIIPVERMIQYRAKDESKKIRILTPLAAGDINGLCGSLSSSQKAIIVAQQIRAVVNMHNAGVIHRDIKPDNILIFIKVDALSKKTLTNSQLTDLDYACKLTDLKERSKDKGSPYYLPPEVIKALKVVDKGEAMGKAMSKAGQLWSLGITLNCMEKNSVPPWFIDLGPKMENFPKMKELFWAELKTRQSPWWPEKGSVLDCMLQEDPDKRITDEELSKLYPESE